MITRKKYLFTGICGFRSGKVILEKLGGRIKKGRLA